MDNNPRSQLLPGGGSQKSTCNFWRLCTLFVALAVVGVGVFLIVHFTNSKSSSDEGTLIKLSDNVSVSVAVDGSSAFRLSFIFDGKNRAKLATPMISAESPDLEYTTTVNKTLNLTTVESGFGKLVINSFHSTLSVHDNAGKMLVSTVGVPHLFDHKVTPSVNASSADFCAVGYLNYKPSVTNSTPYYPYGLEVQDMGDCCAACDNDTDCTVWVFTPHYVNDSNCFPLTGADLELTASPDAVVGGSVVAPESHVIAHLTASLDENLYGRGCGSNDANTLVHTMSKPQVANTEFNTPYYYSDAGYSAFVVSSLNYKNDSKATYPVDWTSTATDITWTVSGSTADLYVMPAKTQEDGLSSLFDLTGRAPVPPMYAFGFMACRWGWTDHEYILNTLEDFRKGGFPIDAFISDFEWYTPHNDYDLPANGSASFVDFGYNNVTFPSPAENLEEYHNDLGVRFGGIRKPRLGNTSMLEMARSNGWLLDGDSSTGAAGAERSLDFSQKAVREWYGDQLKHFLDDGVDFFWNDEGETFYQNFYYWTLAQKEMAAKKDSSKRFFTINRSFMPGNQRLGAVTWTGDVEVSWTALQQQPGYVLNWALAGSPYVTADTGGFNGGDVDPLLLTRWYQASAFMPLMRVHSTYTATPHFPFLYGKEAASAMRNTLKLRYQMVPYHYSLAHELADGGKPIFRPMIMEFVNETEVADSTSQWMDGSSVLVCPVLSASNSSSCYLPEGDWYVFNSSTMIEGGTTKMNTHVGLSNIPLYVKAGSILPLATGDSQSTANLTNSPLEIQVYGGDNGTFVLFQDDGETTHYKTGAVKKTVFSWNDVTEELSWSSVGSFRESLYTQLFGHYFVDGETFLFNVTTFESSGVLAFGQNNTLF
jgi:alpha-glucosidase